MSEVKNKRILKEIAKRFAKSVVYNSEAAVHFWGQTDLLTDEGVAYIQECLHEIAERITDKPISTDTETLVAEYFKFEE